MVTVAIGSIMALRRSIQRIAELLHQEHPNKYTYIPIAHTIKNKHSSDPHILPNTSPLDLARVLLTPSLLYKSLNITPQVFRSFHSSEMTSLVMRTHVHKVPGFLDPRDWCGRNFVWEVGVALGFSGGFCEARFAGGTGLGTEELCEDMLSVTDSIGGRRWQ